jgi:hypothetical protein
MILTGSLILGTIITTVALFKRKDVSLLTQPRATLPTMNIQIICGNCAGEDERPKRTFLDRFGNCEQCNGHSYILASTMYARHEREVSDLMLSLEREWTGGRK